MYIIIVILTKKASCKKISRGFVEIFQGLCQKSRYLGAISGAISGSSLIQRFSGISGISGVCDQPNFLLY